MKKIIRFTMLALVFTLTLGGVTIKAETSGEPHIFNVKTVFAPNNGKELEQTHKIASIEDASYEIVDLKHFVTEYAQSRSSYFRVDSIDVIAGDYHKSFNSIDDIPENEQVLLLSENNYAEIELRFKGSIEHSFGIQVIASDEVNTIKERSELQGFKAYDKNSHTFELSKGEVASIVENYSQKGFVVTSIGIRGVGTDYKFRSVEELPETMELIQASESELSSIMTQPLIYINLLKYYPDKEVVDENPYGLHNLLGRGGAGGKEIFDVPYLAMPTAGSKVDKIRVIFPTLNIDEVNNSYYERYITTIDDSNKYMRLRSFDDLSLEPSTDPYIMTIRNLAMQINGPRLNQDYLDYNNISDFYERYSEEDFATYYIVYNQDTNTSQIYKRGLIDGKLINNGVNMIAEIPGNHVNYFTLIPDGIIPGYDYSDQVPHPEIVDGNTPFSIKFDYSGYGYGFGGRVSEHESILFSVPQNIGDYPDLKFVGYGLTKDAKVPIVQMNESEPLTMNTIELLTQLQPYVEENGFKYNFEFYPVYVSKKEPGKEEPGKEEPTVPDNEEHGTKNPTDKEELDNETPINPNLEKPIEKEVVKESANDITKSNDKENNNKANETVKTGVAEQPILYAYGLLITIASLVLVSLFIKKRNLKD